MQSKQPLIWLEDICDACNEIISYVKSVSRDDFIREPMRYNATILMISIIGEAISNLESDFKASYPFISWLEIKDMRNNLIHEYWQTDLDQIYLSATQEIPVLKEKITKIIEDINQQDKS